jgi:hypothetical protein
MEIKEGIFRGNLITIGRTSGAEHSVELRGVKHAGKIYFSRHRPDSDWFKNAIKNPKVIVVFHGSRFSGNAKMVTNEDLNQKISQLKYPGEERANEKRVAIEITLYE